MNISTKHFKVAQDYRFSQNYASGETVSFLLGNPELIKCTIQTVVFIQVRRLSRSLNNVCTLVDLVICHRYIHDIDKQTDDT